MPLLLFVATSFLSFGVGQLPWFSFVSPAPILAQLGGLAVFLLSAGAFLLVAHQVHEIVWLQRLTWLFVIIGAGIVIEHLFPGVSGFTKELSRQRAYGSLFWTWFVALALSQALFNKRLGIQWRLVLFGLVIGVFYITMFQARRWSSGWVPAMVAIVGILWAASPRIGFVATIGAGIVAAMNVQELYNFVMVGDNPFSLMTRLEAWRILLEVIKVNPLLGLGPANYHWYVALFPILGFYVPFNSHNQYVDIAAQVGLLGLACFIWFMWEVGRLGWRLRVGLPEGFTKAYVYGALGGLVGTLSAGMLGDWILPFVYNVGFNGFRASILGWLFLGGLVSLINLTESDQSISVVN
jgi:hypothetical protein